MTNATEGFWQLEGVRLTAFPVDPLTVDGVDWWQRVTGSAPDNSSIDRRKGTTVQAGVLPGEARLEAATLALYIEPLRVQWSLLPSADETVERQATLGRWHDCVPPFHALMKRWLAFAPSINRLAFGAVLMGEVADLREGYTKLAEFLPFEVDLDSSDFLFQTNKQIDSEADNSLRLNRLTKWSVARIELMTFPVVGSATPVVAKTTLLTASRLELDINTAPEGVSELSSDSLESVWEELIQTGEGVANRGVREW